MIDVVRDPRYPDWIPWRRPIQVSVPGGATGLGCRICIAQDGLKGAAVGDLAQTREEFDRHMREAHDLDGDWSGT